MSYLHYSSCSRYGRYILCYLSYSIGKIIQQHRFFFFFFSFLALFFREDAPKFKIYYYCAGHTSLVFYYKAPDTSIVMHICMTIYSHSAINKNIFSIKKTSCSFQWIYNRCRSPNPVYINKASNVNILELYSQKAVFQIVFYNVWLLGCRKRCNKNKICLCESFFRPLFMV